jgi:hypothetical protein
MDTGLLDETGAVGSQADDRDVHPELVQAAEVLRSRASALRAMADDAHQLVALAYRRRAAELELVAAVADARHRRETDAA